MIPNKIISIARKQTGNTPTGIVTAADAFDYLNIVLGDFWSDICAQNTGRGENTWTYDIIGGTGGYDLATPIAGAETFGLITIDKIGIKYKTTDINYTPVILKYLEGMLELPEFYTDGASKSDPIALIGDTGITIYPTPNASVTDGLQVVGQKQHYDLSETTPDTEAVMLVPSHWHDVLIDGLKVRFYGARGSDFENLKSKAAAEYETNKLSAINQLMDRNQISSESFIPDLSIRG